jgi:hypothetical protein
MASRRKSGPGADEKNGSTEMLEYVDAKRSSSDLSSAERNGPRRRVPTTGREIVAEVLTAEDDPTVNPWTFRMWFIGIGLSVFASTMYVPYVLISFWVPSSSCYLPSLAIGITS